MQPKFVRRAQVEGTMFLGIIFVLFAGFLLFVRGLFGPGQDFEKYRGQIVVLNSEQHFSQATNGNIISVIGELRNESLLGWKDVQLEAQFYDRAGRLIDVRSESKYTEVLGPGQTQAFRLRGPADKPGSAYASHKVFVRSARDAKAFP
jgi:hypothetical protein